MHVCTPDQSLSDPKSPSGINWKVRFKLYKRAILRFPDKYRMELLSWYDNQVFAKVNTVSPGGSGSLDQGIEDVEDLVERLYQAEVTHVGNCDSPSTLSLPAQPLAQPMEAEPGPLPISRSPSHSADSAPSPSQTEQLEEPITAEDQYAAPDAAPSKQPRVTRSTKGKAKKAGGK
jgi:hypothetical protein